MTTSSLILVSCSNSIYAIEGNDSWPVMMRPKGLWPFKKTELGFFGICHHGETGRILFASRINLGWKMHRAGYDTRIWSYDPASKTTARLLDLPGVQDVHQIATWKNWLILTDTGTNRVHLVDLAQKAGKIMLHFGTERIDANHVNASTVIGNRLLVGLNNRGIKAAEIWEFDLAQLTGKPDSQVQAEEVAQIRVLENHIHTHDIEPVGQDLLYSVSHESKIFRVGDPAPFLTLENWIRGLAQDGDTLWVGESMVAKRSERHKKNVDAAVYQINLATRKVLRKIRLSESGQVNDLICLPRT